MHGLDALTVALIRAEGVVLRLRDLGDTSRIVTVYTREQGKFALVAKAARTPKSRFGAALLPGAHVALVLYQRETRDLRYLSHADLLSPAGEGAGDLETLACLAAVCELLDTLIAGEDVNPALFALTLEMLDVLRLRATSARAADRRGTDSFSAARAAVGLGAAAPAPEAVGDALGARGGLHSSPGHAGAGLARDEPDPARRRAAWLLAFQLRTAGFLGLRPELFRCVACRAPAPGAARFAARRGGILCERCGDREAESFTVSAGALAELRLLGAGPLASLGPLPSRVEPEIETVLDVFLRCHVSHYTGLRSREMLKRLAGIPRT